MLELRKDKRLYSVCIVRETSSLQGSPEITFYWVLRYANVLRTLDRNNHDNSNTELYAPSIILLPSTPSRNNRPSRNPIEHTKVSHGRLDGSCPRARGCENSTTAMSSSTRSMLQAKPGACQQMHGWFGWRDTFKPRYFCWYLMAQKFSGHSGAELSSRFRCLGKTHTLFGVYFIYEVMSALYIWYTTPPKDIGFCCWGRFGRFQCLISKVKSIPNSTLELWEICWLLESNEQINSGTITPMLRQKPQRVPRPPS